MKTYQYFWRLIRYSAKYFITDISTATVFWMSHLILGLILRAFFDYLTSAGEAGLSVGPVVALQIGYALLAAAALAAAILANTALRYRSMALMIRNMFARILEMPGARPLPLGTLLSCRSLFRAIRTPWVLGLRPRFPWLSCSASTLWLRWALSCP